jgi:hypothetical protein
MPTAYSGSRQFGPIQNSVPCRNVEDGKFLFDRGVGMDNRRYHVINSIVGLGLCTIAQQSKFVRMNDELVHEIESYPVSLKGADDIAAVAASSCSMPSTCDTCGRP